MKKIKKQMKVWRNNGNGQKLVTVPKNSGIEVGEMVELVKVTSIKEEEKKEDEQERS